MSLWSKLWFAICFPPKFFYASLTLLFWLIIVVIATISMLTGLGEAVLGLLLFLGLFGQTVITWLWLRAKWMRKKAQYYLDTIGTGVSNKLGKLGGFTLETMGKGKVVFRDKTGNIVGKSIDSAKSGIDRLK